MGVCLHFASAFPLRSWRWFLQKLEEEACCGLADGEKLRTCILIS